MTDKPRNADVVDTLQRAADVIRELDGGDKTSETGWASLELLDIWLDLLDVIEKAKGVKR